MVQLSAGPAAAAARARVFISYSRKDLAFARQLAQGLQTADYEVWIDLEGIRPSDDWMAAIRSAIEAHDAVVFVVSPDSVDPRSVCAAELEIALECEKRLIPVICRGVDTRTVHVAPAVARLNWVPFIDSSVFAESLYRLREALDTDLEWVREHTRLTVRAAEWQRANRDDSFVLQKADLKAAEAWLQSAKGKQPAPTPLQTEYVLNSRASAQRRRRRLLAGASVAVVLVIAGAGIAAWQSQIAADRQRESTARALAAEALFERSRRLDRSIALAERAVRTREAPETLDAALSVAQASANIVRFLRGHQGPIRALCFVADDAHLLSVGQNGIVILWNLERAAPVEVLTPLEPGTSAIACHPKLPQVAVWRGGARLDLLRMEGDRLAAGSAIDGASAAFSLLAYSGDGRWLATSNGSSFVIRTAADGTPTSEPVETETGFTTMALSADGEWLVAGTQGVDSLVASEAGQVVLWRQGEAKPRFVRDAFALATRQVGFGTGTGPVLAIGIEGEIKTWSLDGQPVELKLPEALQSSESRAASFDPAGHRFVTASGRSTTVVAELAEAASQPLQPLAPHGRPLSATTLDGAGRYVATGDESGMIIVHRMRSAERLNGGRRVSEEADIVDAAAFSADGRHVLLRLVQDGRPFERVISLPSFERVPPGNAASAASASFAVAVEETIATLRQSGSTAPLGVTVFEEGPLMASAATGDGRHWAAATLSSVRFLAGPTEPPIVAMLPPNFGEVSAVALRADGRLAAVAGGDTSTALGMRFGMNAKSIVLFDTVTGRAVGAPLSSGRPDEIQTLAFSPDERYLLSLSSEAAVWVVDAALQIRQACDTLKVDAGAASWSKLPFGRPTLETCR